MDTKKTLRTIATTLMMGLVLPVLTGCPQTTPLSDESASVGTTTEKNFVPGRILVQYRQDVKGEKAKGIIAAAGGKEVDAIESLGVSVVELPGSMDGEAQVNALSACPEVAFAELDPVAVPDFTVNDPSYATQWHLKKIAAPTAWDSTLGDSSVIIAILDTGVNSLHPDLASKIVAGWNTYDNNADTSDVYGHGTAVAGSAAASSNNGVGVAAPAVNCKIMPMRISDKSGLGYGSTIASALTWAANHGARVANVSFRMDFSATVTAAAQYFMSKGGVVTMSAGNENTYYASATDNPYVLTVGATTSTDALASFTNTGGNIDLVAPGCSIYTTNRAGAYSSWSGTSFSAPITAGVAALVISAKPSLTGAQVQDILEQSADDLGATGYDTGFGWGRLNAAKAVAMANPTATTTTTTPTTATSTTTTTTTSTTSTATSTTDTTKPVITITGSAYPTVTVLTAYTELGATATDNKDGDITSKIVMTGTVNTSVIGTYYVTYTVKDAAGNATSVKRTVKVVDNVKPVITITGSAYPSIKLASTYTELGATAQDNFSGNLTSKITMTGTVNTSVIGTYTITYTVKDAAGNTTTAKRTVKVIA